MIDRDWAARFSNDLDQLLQTGMLADTVDETSGEYAAALWVAQALSSIDFDNESKKRYKLRQRLLAKIDTQESRSENIKESVSMNTPLQKQNIKFALSTIVLVGLLGLLFTNLIWPGSVAAAAKSAVSFVQRAWIGEYTSISPISQDQIIEMEDGSLVMQGEYISENGDAGKVSQYGSSTVTFDIRWFDDLAEAQAILPFSLVQPDVLPETYVFSGVKVFGEGDLASAHIHYSGPDGDLLLSQRPIGGQKGQTVSIGLPESYTVESVRVNGQVGTWAEHVLMWEAGGVSYLLSSPGLRLSDAIQIAKSLK